MPQMICPSSIPLLVGLRTYLQLGVLAVLQSMGTCARDSCGFLVKGDAGNGINSFGSRLLPAILDATSQKERWIDKA